MHDDALTMIVKSCAPSIFLLSLFLTKFHPGWTTSGVLDNSAYAAGDIERWLISDRAGHVREINGDAPKAGVLLSLVLLFYPCVRPVRCVYQTNAGKKITGGQY